MGRRLVATVLARNPSTQELEGFGPHTADVPEWVHEQAPGAHLWVDDVTGELADDGADPATAREQAADVTFGVQADPDPPKPRRARRKTTTEEG